MATAEEHLQKIIGELATLLAVERASVDVLKARLADSLNAVDKIDVQPKRD